MSEPNAEPGALAAMNPAERLALAQIEASLVGGAVALPIVAGRYTVRGVLGRGGMGEVVRAHDRELDREVALKYLRGDPRGPALVRFVREARAVARLAHPNVVRLFDVIADDAGVYLVLELVRGPTLRAWASAQTRTRAEITRALIEAGRGLAAAHAAGVLHLDVKPDNIMIGQDGVARMVDFGLARDLDAHAEDTAGTTPTNLGVGVTTSGTHGDVMGTRGYVAPERLAGAPPSASADQYGFAVTCRELLGTAIEDRVARVVARGCADDPAARWPSVAVMLRALEHPRSHRRRGLLAALGVVAAVAAFGSSSPVPPPAAAAEPARAEPRRELAPETAQAIAHAQVLARAGRPFAARAQLAAAEAAADAGARSAIVFARASLAADLDELDPAEADYAAAHALAVEAGDGARAFEAALAMGKLLAHRRMRPDLAEPWFRHAEVAAADAASRCAGPRLGVARGDLLVSEGRYREASAALGLAVAELDGCSYIDPELRAWARNDHGRALHLAGDDRAALAELRTARGLFVAAGADPLAIATATENLGNTLAGLGRDDDAIAAHLEALDLRSHAPSLGAAALADSWINIGVVLSRHGRIGEAIAAHQRALAILTATRGAAHPTVAKTLINLATMSPPETARVLLQRALVVEEQRVGSEHADVATLLLDLGVAENELGHLARARAAFERAYRIRTSVFGPDHPQTAYALHNLGVVAHASNDVPAAIELLEQALAIRQQISDRGLRATTEHALSAALADGDAACGRALELARAAAEAPAEVANRTIYRAHRDALVRRCG